MNYQSKTRKQAKLYFKHKRQVEREIEDFMRKTNRANFKAKMQRKAYLKSLAEEKMNKKRLEMQQLKAMNREIHNQMVIEDRLNVKTKQKRTLFIKAIDYCCKRHLDSKEKALKAKENIVKPEKSKNMFILRERTRKIKLHEKMLNKMHFSTESVDDMFKRKIENAQNVLQTFHSHMSTAEL